MFNKYRFVWFMGAILALFVLVACGSAAEPQIVEVEREVVVEKEVPVEVVKETIVEVPREVERVVEREVVVEKEVPVEVVKETVVEKEVEVEKVVEVMVEAPKGTIIFGDLSWDSALLQNRIAQYLVEFGYGYPTETKAGDTLPLFQGLKRGDTDVAMEIWLPNQNDAWEAARAEGAVLSVGKSLGSDWQSAFVIPAYLQDEYPELDSVEDLKEQQYKDLFKTAETGDKARLVSCVIGWACEVVNAKQVEGYGLSDHVEIVNPGSGALLNADLNGAYEKQEPWLGYQWGTNDPALQLDLVRLEEPPYSVECEFSNWACGYRDATILIAVNPDLPAEAPEVVGLLRNWDFNIDIYKSAVRWRGANPDAGINETALWWLNSFPAVWGPWVSEEAGEKVQAALAAGKTPEGWPES